MIPFFFFGPRIQDSSPTKSVHSPPPDHFIRTLSSLCMFLFLKWSFSLPCPRFVNSRDVIFSEDFKRAADAFDRTPTPHPPLFRLTPLQETP